MDFKPRDDCNYKFNYEAIFSDIAAGHLDPIKTYRQLIKEDLFFIVHFLMEIPPANHPFIVDRCREVEEGPKTNTLDIWAREHFKSTIITVGETVQTIINDPEKTTVIFSYKKPAAEKFLDSIRSTLMKDTMIKCFPDICWEKPESEAPVWSLQNGIVVKRNSTTRKERTVEAYGLIEGMPTGGHWDRRIYDDVETADLARNPEQLDLCFRQFEYSDYLGTQGGIKRVIGTYYHHAGPLVRIQEKRNKAGDLMYGTRLHPGSADGTPNGDPVFVTKDRWEELQVGEHFNQQILCDPTPTSNRDLKAEYIKPIEPEFIPPDVMKFMVIDPAGDQATQRGKDSWAMGVFGVQPTADEAGASNIYILDLEIQPRTNAEAVEAASRMYLRNGVIMSVGVEKVGQSTAEIHIANALSAHNRMISQDAGTLILLKPSGRKKEDRIVSALQWPLNNGKWHYSTDVNYAHIQRLKDEMDKFPVWHDDGLDICAYLYDIIKDFRFSRRPNLRPLPYRKTGVV